MGQNKTRVLMQFAALAVVLTAAMMVEEAKSIPVCNVDSSDVEKCRSAATGNNPPPPGPDCCNVVKTADLQCFCQFKSYLPSYGINPSNVKTVLARCGANTPACFQA
ncbi:hypothetical protein EUTSA_v10015086mg [Eutrema salsugineum]|uniref:Bifunctional inhibitor/plant lipid transfer protein/seed storage helical domain-containing protein n=1 Tax=Eutrema salsugineum TaxID=72664 RepID=V4LGP1_EUTSA|nr:putative lipid-transfer protein DIR1 [Eutrema salsugineum]ESQ42909.1 hypothetical protein EUTSA_v10015086mg [Eutrema salsugineum]